MPKQVNIDICDDIGQHGQDSTTQKTQLFLKSHKYR